LWEALFASERADEKRTRELLGEAFAVGRRHGYFNLFWWWLPDDMSRLCGIALEHGIETGYAQKMVLLRGLKPIRRHQVESWPWTLRIYTLGRFGIVHNDEPLGFSGKVQQKPLALLKAAIAHGGRNVSEEQLIESLWPETEGDVGHLSFSTTLHRLRKLIDSEKALILSEGKVTLNPNYCWVDAWAFERMANELLKRPFIVVDADAIIRNSDRCISLYTGHFLASEDNQLWAISTRERLRSKLLRIITATGQLLETTGKYEEAISLYQRGLECDNMIEEFYQRIMNCHARLGNRGQVHATFSMCREIMKTLDTTPSVKTSELCHLILNGK
jgi:DNA-binding SARP family transcriptional activator